MCTSKIFVHKPQSWQTWTKRQNKSKLITFFCISFNIRSQKTSSFVKSLWFTPPLETWWLHLNRINTAGSEATVMLMWDDWLVKVQCASLAQKPEQILWCKADARAEGKHPHANTVKQTSFIKPPAGRSMQRRPILAHSDKVEMCTNKWALLWHYTEPKAI